MVPQTVIGWDLGKFNSYVTATDNATGEVIRKGKVPNTPADMRAAVEGLARPIRLVFEATGNWMYAYENLEGMVDEIQMAHPMKTKAIASAKIKTDSIDAGTLAKLGRADMVPQSWIPPREVRDLREMLRHRSFLVTMQTKMKNRIRTYLDKVGASPKGLSTLFCKKGLEYLRDVELREPFRTLMNCDLGVYGEIQKRVEELTGRINLLAKEDPRAALLLPIRGLGPYSVMLVLSEIGDIGRFERPQKLVSYAGLCPSTYQSGTMTRHGRITKQGSRWLRWILVEAATHYKNAPGRLGSFYRKMTIRKGVKVARVALAREMLHSIFWCLKKGVVYREV